MRSLPFASPFAWLWLLGMVAAVTAAVAAGGPTAGRPIPSMTAVRTAVEQYFQTQTGYQSGDWITRQSVEPLLARLTTLGLPLLDAQKIVADTPTNDEFLTVQLSTPAGRKFMRQIARYPNAYDRLDRLSRLSNGRRTVQDLIRGPGGQKMIEYLTTASGGRELGRMLSKAPNGGNFNAPTGRIYTEGLLLERLAQSRDASLKAAEEQSGKKTR